MKIIKPKILHLSQIEKRDLFKAWAALSFAFAVAFKGLTMDPVFFLYFAVAGLTVGVGFIAHELMHRIVAKNYGCWAEFRSFDQMLMLAILFSFFGFILAAPGAVMIKGRVTRKENGIISVAGIWANIAVALLFFAIMFIPNSAAALIGGYGFMINSWLALFNMLPFFNFDGRKVLAWSKVVYFTTAFVAVVLFLLQGAVRA